VNVTDYRTVELGENVQFAGPGVLALDGERERGLKPGQIATLRVLRDGPWVIDVEKALNLAAQCRLFDAQELE
jgi:hypothetical protein